jgi:hypothetical protein
MKATEEKARRGQNPTGRARQSYGRGSGQVGRRPRRRHSQERGGDPIRHQPIWVHNQLYVIGGCGLAMPCFAGPVFDA